MELSGKILDLRRQAVELRSRVQDSTRDVDFTDTARLIASLQEEITESVFREADNGKYWTLWTELEDADLFVPVPASSNTEKNRLALLQRIDRLLKRLDA